MLIPAIGLTLSLTFMCIWCCFLMKELFEDEHAKAIISMILLAILGVVPWGVEILQNFILT